MNHLKDTSGGGFAIGLLVGAAAGAGLALLFAPKPGAELRGELGQSMNSLRDAAARRLKDVADRAGAGLHEWQAAAGKAAGAAAVTAREMLDAAGDPGRPDGRIRT